MGKARKGDRKGRGSGETAASVPTEMTAFEAAARAAVASRGSPETRQTYIRTLERWIAFATARGADPTNPPDDLAPAFRDSLAADLENETVRNHLAALSFVYRRLTAKRPSVVGAGPNEGAPTASWNPFDPDALAWPPASTIGKTEAVGQDATEAVLAAACKAGALRDVALIHALYATGARRMSIVTMRRDRLYRREGVLWARVKIKGSGGAELAEIVLPEAAAADLEAWLAVAPRSEYVFPSRDKKGSMDLSVANKVLTKWSEAAESSTRVHPHRFRVSFVTDAFSAGVNLRDIQASVHHSDPRSTQRYDRGSRGAGVTEAVAARRSKKSESS